MNREENIHKGILWIVFSAFGFAAMGMFVRLAGDVPFVQKTLFRNLIALFIALSSLIAKGQKDKSVFYVEPKAWKLILLRSIVGATGIYGNFYAIGHINISDAAMLNKMSPFFAVITSIFILGEKANYVTVISLILAFTGSMFVVKPTLANSELFPSIIAFIGGVGAGVASALVRKISKYNVNGLVIISFFSFFSSLLAIPYMIFHYYPMNLQQTLSLLGAGIGAAMGQFGMTNAYYNAPAYKISVFDYSNIIFSATMGFLVFGQIPDRYSFIGYLLIISAAVYVYIKNNKSVIKK